MKSLYKLVFLGLLIFITVSITLPSKAFAGTAAWNGVSRSDADWYYYDNGLCYYWQYSGYNSNMYEETWGYWTDTKPKIDTTTMYNNQDIRDYRVMGTLADFGFTAINADWVGSRFAGNDGAPANVIYQRKVSTDYKRAKTSPSSVSVTVSGNNYTNGSDLWVKPSTTVQMQVTGYQNYLGNKVQLDDWVNQNYLRLVGNDGSDFRDTYIYNSGFQNFSQVSGINTSYNTSSYSSDDRTYYTTFNIQVTNNNMDYDIQSLAHSYNGKLGPGNSYVDSGMNLRVDGDAPSYNSSSITGAIYQSGSTYWTTPGSSVYVNLRQYDGRSGNQYSYLRLYANGLDVRSQHDFHGATNYNNQFATDPNLTISSASRTENSGGYGTVQYTVVPQNTNSWDVMYYFIDNVDNQFANYVSTGSRIAADGYNPTVLFRNSTDTANLTSRGWSSASNDVRLKFADGESGYKQSRYAWSTSTTTPGSWSGWSTSSDYTVTKNTKGQWYLHVQAQDNVGNTITTYNGPYNYDNAPVANFSSAPSTVYNNTSVSFTNSSTDGDGDALTYQWAYQQPNSATWVNFSTSLNPTQVLNSKGTWNIKLTVSDGILSNSVTKAVTVQNRPPLANFTWNPSIVYNDTNVSITNSSVDADGDPLTYQWEYQQPGSATWVSFSAAVNPAKVFNVKGQWNIRLTANDGTVTGSITKALIVQNRSPLAGFTTDQTSYYVGDSIKITSTATDPDKDLLTYLYEVTRPDGKVDTYTTANPTISNILVGAYSIKQTVTDDSGASASVTKGSVLVKDLTITGHVGHTSSWQAKHLSMGHSVNQFYSGETFLLSADVTDYPINRVEVGFSGYQSNGNLYTTNLLLSKSNPVLYTGVLDEPNFANSGTRLANGNSTFTFTVYYSNGIIRTGNVVVDIIGSVYDAISFHQKY